MFRECQASCCDPRTIGKASSWHLCQAPSDLLRQLRIPVSQRSLLECFVKPAGSQVQTAGGQHP